MNKLILFFLLITLGILGSTQLAFGQLEEGGILRAKVSIINYQAFPAMVVGGLEGNWLVADYVSLNYRVQGGKDFIHLPATVPIGLVVGLIFTIRAVKYGCGYPENLWGIFLIPEGVSFPIPISTSLLFSPQLNPLGFEYYQYNDRDYAYMVGDFGAELSLLIDEAFFMSIGSNFKVIYGEQDAIFKDANKGFGINFNIGYKF